MADRLRHAEVLDLRIGENLVYFIDRTARYPRFIERLDPFRRSAIDGLLPDFGIQRIAVRGAQIGVDIVRMFEQIRSIDRLAQP